MLAFVHRVQWSTEELKDLKVGCKMIITLFKVILQSGVATD